MGALCVSSRVDHQGALPADCVCQPANDNSIATDSSRPLIICGPSGVGKGTVIKALMEQCPGSFGFSVSHTTRGPRPGEVDGVHYHFADRGTMQKDIDAGRFLEYADVHGNLYGTSLLAVEKVRADGKICVLDIDVQGAEIVNKRGIDATYVFISPPSVQELEARLRGRGTESEASIQKRLGNATGEMEKASEVGFFEHNIVNRDVDQTVVEVMRAVGLC
eukprot:CAMPEP_0177771942 /NCGR_PEP_ID=MMETSP0491_2-20121128/11917_1 /TAXON_ID=63592 /ORGANISM="Tetraselmis chuii, Strain PLY429" /LENGTH=219 /DNA_ID=CAMNT_0019289637 /DNA_START=256 /DNA_END=915 /DNA_ORIENTATION=+